MKALMVHAVLYREDDLFLAHCLEFDLVAQGETPEQAYHNLLDAIELQTEFVREQGDLGNLIQPAPVEYWQMLASAERFTPPANGWQLPSSVSAVECGLVGVLQESVVMNAQEINNMERLEHSMTMTPTTPFEAALDVIDRLPPDDQEAIIEIVRRRIIDRRRREIADNAQATLQAFREGRASYGTVDDLRRELQA